MLKYYAGLLVSALLGMSSASADIPSSCDENRLTAPLAASPMSILRGCYNSLPIIAGGADNISDALNTAGLEPTTEANDAERATEAAQRVYDEADNALVSACGDNGEPALCEALQFVRSAAARIVNAESITQSGRNYFDIVIRGNNLAFGSNLEHGEEFNFCGFVERQNRTTASSCTTDANDCDATCISYLKASLKAMPLLNVLKASANVLSIPRLQEDRRNAIRVNAMWDNYVSGGEDGAPQHLLEIYVNGRIHGDKFTQNGGFDIPPTSTAVLLRPDLGVELFEDDGSKIELAAMIELVGFRRWRWDEEGSRENEWGASIIASFSPREDADDWGYGLLFDTPISGLDISWTARDSDTGTQHAILFSANLLDFVPGVALQKACAIFDRPNGCGN